MHYKSGSFMHSCNEYAVSMCCMSWSDQVDSGEPPSGKYRKKQNHQSPYDHGTDCLGREGEDALS